MIKRMIGCFALILGTLSVTGCIQMPTESSQAVDNRPTLMFKSSSRSVNDYQVMVDGLTVGTVGDYQDGEDALRVLSGSHIITITDEGNTILEQKIYLGDGTSKTIVVNQ